MSWDRNVFRREPSHHLLICCLSHLMSDIHSHLVHQAVHLTAPFNEFFSLCLSLLNRKREKERKSSVTCLISFPHPRSFFLLAKKTGDVLLLTSTAFHEQKMNERASSNCGSFQNERFFFFSFSPKHRSFLERLLEHLPFYSRHFIFPDLFLHFFFFNFIASFINQRKRCEGGK